MFGSAILDTAIGMVFVFLVLSLICGIVQELIATLLSWRAATLRKGIQQMLGDARFSGLAKQVYDHPLITGLKKPGSARVDRKLPSYIPSRTFALAIVDLMDPNGTLKQGAEKGLDLVAKIADPTLQAIARSLVSDASSNLESLRHNIEDWFDDSMARVSGWYKRRAQVVTLAIGLVVSIGFNVNTIAVFSTLWKDPTVRAAIVEQAAALQGGDSSVDAALSVASLQKQMKELALPIGWRLLEDGRVDFSEFGLRAILGWVIGAFAVAVGSQFWFDLLSKFLSLRSAGARPSTAAERRGG